VADYVLHCFAQSGNAYKPALMLELHGRRLDAAVRRLFRRRRAPRLSHTQRDGRGAGARAWRRLSQSGVILDYLAGALGQFGAKDDSERRDILRWILFGNHS
jgi:glutathione S-transferase